MFKDTHGDHRANKMLSGAQKNMETCNGYVQPPANDFFYQWHYKKQ